MNNFKVFTFSKGMKNGPVTAICALLLSAGIAEGSICPNNIGFDQPIGDNVTLNMGCEIGNINNDSQSQVNFDMMFGFSDWVFDVKDEETGIAGSDPNTVLLNLNSGAGLIANLQMGTWAFDNASTWSLYSDVMMVLKDGDDQPDTYVGYLIKSGELSGNYKTPFLNTTSSNPKDISHISVYVRAIPVPEPGTYALLGMGLSMIGFRRLRALRS